MCLGACIIISLLISLTSTTNLPLWDTPWWTAEHLLLIVGAPGRGVRLIHGEPDGPQINSAFSSSISWRSMSVYDDDSSLATSAPTTADPILEPPPRSSSPTTHCLPGARRQCRPDNAIRRRPDAPSKDHRPGDRITWCSGFPTDQLVGPLGSWTPSPIS